MKRYSLLAIAILSACTSSEPLNDLPGEPDGASCMEVLDCMEACFDDTCANACLADSSPEARRLIDELVTCVDRNGCVDATCIQTNCGEALDACFDDLGGGPDVPQGTPLPASIAGSWSYQDAGASLSYQFTPDGRVSHVGTLLTGGGSCGSSYVVAYDGVVELSANLLAVTIVNGSFQSTACDGTVSASGPHTDPEAFRVATGADAQGDFLTLTKTSTDVPITFRRF